MKPIIFVLMLVTLFSLILSSCATPNASNLTEQPATLTSLPDIDTAVTITPGPTVAPTAQVTGTFGTEVPTVLGPTPSPEITQPPLDTQSPGNAKNSEGDAMKTIIITVGDSTFQAKLYDNETTRALLAQFPLRLNMSELNGKEKYYNSPENLPATVTEQPATIQAGEIMLWSSNVLVLFYNTFPNSYGGYVKLGYVEDVTGLEDALGSGDVQVTFSVGY